MPETQEKWKTIEGFEAYEISDIGRVRNAATNRVLKLQINRYGYVSVGLSSYGKHKSMQVHRLVAKAFVPNSADYPEVNHIDEDKTNNKASNLEWCTRKYNVNYGNARLKHSERKSKPVIQYKDGIEVARYSSIKLAGQTTGCDPGGICQCCRKNPKYTHVGGFTFRYA